MTFAPTRVNDFLALFDATSTSIRRQRGCRHLELWRDERFPNIMTTCSHWDSAEDLDLYRRSELFNDTWARTKSMFAASPRARSHTRSRIANEGPKLA